MRLEYPGDDGLPLLDDGAGEVDGAVHQDEADRPRRRLPPVSRRNPALKLIADTLERKKLRDELNDI